MAGERCTKSKAVKFYSGQAVSVLQIMPQLRRSDWSSIQQQQQQQLSVELPHLNVTWCD